MIEPLEGMPAGTIGFRASGRVTRDLVTDVDWIARALHMFAWLTPGEVRLYELGGLEDAKRWVAAGDEEPA